MSEKPESEEFEDEESDEPSAGDVDVDLDQVIKDLDLAKRRATKGGDPAWRRRERLLEDKRTAELTSDFDDYDIGMTETRNGEESRSAGAADGADGSDRTPGRRRRPGR
ncbi:MAG TPA: hypothetical protein VIY54_02190 [Steroidobacteraceae bacterium]